MLNPSTNVNRSLCSNLSCLRCCDRFPDRGAIYISKVSSCPIVGDGRSFGLLHDCPTPSVTSIHGLSSRSCFQNISCDRACFHRPRSRTSRAHLLDVISIRSKKCCISVFHDHGYRNNSGVRSCFCRGLKRRVAIATTSKAPLAFTPSRRLDFTNTRLCTCSCVCSRRVIGASGSVQTSFVVRPSGKKRSVHVAL